MRKYVTNSAVINSAGAGVTGTDITSFDDNQNRHVVGVFASGLVAGANLRVVLAGGTKAEIGGLAFNAAAGFIPLDLTYPVGQYFHVDVNNITGTAAATIWVTLAYEVPG